MVAAIYFGCIIGSKQSEAKIPYIVSPTRFFSSVWLKDVHMFPPDTEDCTRMLRIFSTFFDPIRDPFLIPYVG